jgi:hypothetical protein
MLFAEGQGGQVSTWEYLCAYNVLAFIEALEYTFQRFVLSLQEHQVVFGPPGLDSKAF